jgi:phosphatidylglycerol:prolipoprotein diacylglycerol transferase
VLATFLHDLSPFVFEIRPGIGPRWYGFSYVLSFVLGFLLYRWLAVRRYTEMPAEKVSDFITWAALFGVMLGGRIGWMIFYGSQQDHTGDPWWWPLEVWKGGMSSHGGILGLVLFTLYYARKHKVSWTSIGDSLCVVAPIGLFLVRCANFINGELFGKVSGAPGGPATIPWPVVFPTELGDSMPPLEVIQKDEAVRQALLDTLPPRHPSQIYEALLEGVVLFAVLWFMRTRCRVPRGVITGAFFILYAALRIIGEIYRVPDPAWSVGTISAGQFLSIFLFAIGAVFIVWGLRTRQYEVAVQART